jgi:cyclic pyranopterin phosphate synthase
MSELSHIDANGKANMVDISHKPIQTRTAVAQGFIHLATQTITLIRSNLMKKGDVVTIAEIAGIMAAKKTSDLIPLCHPIQTTKVEVSTVVHDNCIEIKSFAKCLGQTGIEMEALTAVSIALLTVYDMCKAVDKSMVISSIKLIDKQKS